MILVLSIAASATTLLSMHLLSNHDRRGFLVSLLNQPIWIGLNVLTEAYGLHILSVCMTVISIRGYYKWGK